MSNLNRRRAGNKFEVISPAEISEQISYDPETGVFTWAVSRRSCKIGKEAGHIKRGYRCIRVFQRDFSASHIAFAIMTGRWPDFQNSMEIDHINRNTLDDRWENLREATSSQQKLNRTPKQRKPENSHLPVGVNRNGSGYRAFWYKNDGKTYVSPTFHSLEEAIKFRNDKMIELGYIEYLPKN